MPDPRVTVVIPTLNADTNLVECLQALRKQTRRDFEVIVVDNSERHLVRSGEAGRLGATILENHQNVGFGAAINQGFRHARAPFLATLNDDAVASPAWIEELLAAIESRPEVGMCASQVRLADELVLDSAGMLICGDGSSKQRGHGDAPDTFRSREEVLLPSASAALYRRSMLDQIGAFDEDFFLYCEDTDLGLRARWAGWKCLYVPKAIVQHRYSATSGRASPLKAYYVERNRLFLLVKNFPFGMILRAPVVSAVRYAWHMAFLLQGSGMSGRFREEGRSSLDLVWFVIRAHIALLLKLPSLWRKRRQVRRNAKLSSAEFRELLKANSITARQVAAL